MTPSPATPAPCPRWPGHRDGHTLATASADTTVLLWDFTGLAELRDQAVARACVAAGGGLTEEEWGRYITTLPYEPTCT